MLQLFGHVLYIVTQEDVTRDCIRLTLPYADTLIKIDIIYESDNETKGHELCLSALGVTSRKTALRIMTNVCHDITKASLFDGVLALYNAVREDQMLLAEQTTNKVVGGQVDSPPLFEAHNHLA